MTTRDEYNELYDRAAAHLKHIQLEAFGVPLHHRDIDHDVIIMRAQMVQLIAGKIIDIAESEKCGKHLEIETFFERY